MIMNKQPSTYGYNMPRTHPGPSRPNLHGNTNYHHPRTGTKMAASSKLSHSTHDANDSTLNFYPQLLPTNGLTGESSNSGSNRSPSTRTSLKYASSQATAKNVSFYRSGDNHMQAFKVAITRRNFRTFDSLLESLSDRIPLPFGVRTVSTPHGTHGISRLDEFEDGKSYVCSDKKTVKPLNMKAMQSTRPPWFISKPRTRTRVVAQLVRRPDAETFRAPQRTNQVKTPKKIIIVRNGEPSFRHSILLSRRTPQSFESILDDIGEVFRIRVQKLYTTDGRRIETLQDLFFGPNTFVAASREAFQPMDYRFKRVAISDDTKDPNSDLHGNLDKERTPKELKKTKGRWTVAIATSELPAAGTDARVTITVYGTKGNTGPILLNDKNEPTFRSGNEDEFSVNVGSIGEIRKIRISHDNSGTSPGWLCESVTLTDQTTGEILQFPCNRWLSRDEDDGEICRELPARWSDKTVLPEITYVVTVTTGNLWNAGTSANVHMTIFGDLGDCGPRLLQHGGKSLPQVKGTTVVFRMQAVSLGTLYRVVIGHDGNTDGDGWFLERIAIKEDRVGSEEWIFPCNRWLDVGEDDGKIIRELYAEVEPKPHLQSRSRSQAEKAKEDMLWDLEKWKFQRGNQIILLSHATHNAIRVRNDAGIDGLGDPSSSNCVFEVMRRRGNIRVFSNIAQSSFHLALDQNRVLGQGKGGSFCEFQVKVQSDRSVIFESCKYNGQHITFDPSGKPADTRGQPSAQGRLFTVYVKGCFRDGSIILLNTSPTQALAVTGVGDVIGTGRRYDITETKGGQSGPPKQFANFRVVKVAEGVRMFQCEKEPKRYLRIKDGLCDGLGSGDVYCHFKVQKHKLSGYVTLQSMKHRGVFVGLNTNGKARPTVDTGDENTQFYPEVIKFGEKKSSPAVEWRTPEPSFLLSPNGAGKTHRSRDNVSNRSVQTSSVVTLQNREDSNTAPKDGDFRIYVTTGNNGTNETISLTVYGENEVSEPIVLGKGTEGGVFQCGQTDEFQANLLKIRIIKKIRIGVEEASQDCDWRIKQVKMKDMGSNEILKFKFNRWISRSRDDGSTLRELPTVNQDGKLNMPMLRYFVLIRTSKSPTPTSRRKSRGTANNLDPEFYVCLHGLSGDTGRRLLARAPERETGSDVTDRKPMFSPGKLDRFEVEAVTLGELTQCVISCPKSHVSPKHSWSCDEIIVRESEGASMEYVFPCKKWIGVRKNETVDQVVLTLGEKREVKRKEVESREGKDGDWKVSVTTGASEDAGTSSNVIFHAYGYDGSMCGPVLLGSGAQGIFGAGTTEQFKVNLAGVNDLMKVRLSHDNTGSAPEWFVERIKLKCVADDVTHTLNVRKWLSLEREPHQISVEIPIPRPGEELLPVLKYQVLIYTGSILGSDTDASVYITIYGQRGDSGRRPLYKSMNNELKFQESQIDIFEVEAVHLGELTKIEIGHNGIGHGNGWFLHKVLIKESEISPRDYVFFCNRWLDDGQDDGKIERIIKVEPNSNVSEMSLNFPPTPYPPSRADTTSTLWLYKIEPDIFIHPITPDVLALDEDESQEKSSEGQYRVLVTTGLESTSELCPSDARTSLVIYGEEGKTGQILLGPVLGTSEEHSECFKPGQTDEFKIDVPEIGEIYKVRMSISEDSDWHGWYLDKLILEDMATQKQLVFNCNRWLSKYEDDQITVREMPTTRQGEETLPVNLYHVIVAMGDRPGAATDSSIYVTLRGDRGDTGHRKLIHPHAEIIPFQRGKSSHFSLEAVDLGKLNEVIISHNGVGYGAGCFVENVVVRESEYSDIEWLFPCHAWLDDHVGDCKTSRRLMVLGSCESTRDDELVKLASPPSREPSGQYDVTVQVGEVMAQGNEAISLTGVFQGMKSVSKPQSLGEWKPGGAKEFTGKIDVGDLGEITKLRVEMEDSDHDLNLLLSSVQISNEQDSINFHFQRRFKSLNGSTTKEMPALRSYKPSLKFLTYFVHIEMSPGDSEIPSDAKLCLNLIGENGDSGFRTLFRGTNGFSATKRAKGYTFQLELLDLGKLNKVSLAYGSSGSTTGWKIEMIRIFIPAPPNSYAGSPPHEPSYLSSVDHLFKTTSLISRVEKEYNLSPASSADPDVKKIFRATSGYKSRNLVKNPPDASGVWKMTVASDEYDEESPLNQVSVQIFGAKGSSEVFHLSDYQEEQDLISDLHLRSKQVTLGTNIGDLNTVRLVLKQDTMVRIHKIKLKDVSTHQEYLSFISPSTRLNTKPDKDGRIIYDVPLVKPDQDPVSKHKYEIKVHTGDRHAAGTDADVLFTIYGTKGETGPWSFKALSTNPEDIFQAGHEDTFTLETSDVGEPRKVTIGHMAEGKGAGWYLDDVIITEMRDDLETEYTFPCYKWFDDSVDDRLRERDVHVVGSRLKQNGIDFSKSVGKWSCTLHTMPDLKDQGPFDARIVFCINDGGTREKVRHIDQEVVAFDVELGANNADFPHKIRVFNDSTATDCKAWPFSELQMTDNDSREKLRFLFDSAPVWAGSDRGYVRELPVVRNGFPFKPVVTYYVVFCTSSQSDPEFRPSLVTLRLRGVDGDTYWQTIADSENSAGKFQPGRINVFTVEAVSLGDVINYVSINVKGPTTSSWLLERVKVKRGYYDDEEQIFEYDKEIRADESVELTQGRMVPCKSVNKKSSTKTPATVAYDVAITLTGQRADEKLNTGELELYLQLTGNKGVSDVTSVQFNDADSTTGYYTSTTTINTTTAQFGDLSKIGVGFLVLPQPNIDPVLKKLTLRNKENNDYYCFRPNYDFIRSPTKHLTGLNWLELAAVLPRQDTSTIGETCDYYVTIRTSDQEDAGTTAQVYVILTGSAGDSGKRWLVTSSNGDDVSFRPGNELKFTFTSVNVGTIKELVIGHNGRDVTSGWHLDQVTVSSSLAPGTSFVFTCQKWLADLEGDTFIERILPLDHVSDFDVASTDT
uniref:lipoxygenase homology domain-containing protein 1-like isoform X2 n=1 Tax=Ciona intestinalis TaxID=7719 RepID=UPI000EF52D9C|nr:lipoxygenase homology domain-containing protein 1-like isoform X2 [Ciona intestinalis]|eukprot:XP_026691111.1 lipoxygenase homology domain-containing protein 1-like isoform X2 [Ciona intestinalis]